MDSAQDMVSTMTINVLPAAHQDITMMEIHVSPVKKDKSGMETNVFLLQLILLIQLIQIPLDQ